MEILSAWGFVLDAVEIFLDTHADFSQVVK